MAVEAKISFFPLKRGSCALTFEHFCLKWESYELWERPGKFFRAAHPHTPFVGQCPARAEVKIQGLNSEVASMLSKTIPQVQVFDSRSNR